MGLKLFHPRRALIIYPRNLESSTVRAVSTMLRSVSRIDLKRLRPTLARTRPIVCLQTMRALPIAVVVLLVRRMIRAQTRLRHP